MTEQLYSTIGEFTPDNLIAGQEFPIIVQQVEVASGQGVLLRGTVLGINSSTRLASPVDSSANDGTEKPFGILTDNVNTEDDNVVTTCYVSGLFNKSALIFGGSDTADTHEERLRELGIYLKENVEY